MPKFIDGTFLVLVGILAVLVAAAWARGGTELVFDGLGNGTQLLLKFGAVLVVSFLVAGVAEKLIPHESPWVQGAVTDHSIGGLPLSPISKTRTS